MRWCWACTRPVQKLIVFVLIKGGFGGRTVQRLVDVAESVCEVYPRIHDGQSDKILEKGFPNQDHDFGQRKLETREASLLRETLARQIITSKHLRQSRTCALGGHSKTFRIDPNNTQCHWNQVPCMANHTSHLLDLAILISNHRRPATNVQKQPDRDLDDMISYDCLKALPFRDVVSFEFVF